MPRVAIPAVVPAKVATAKVEAVVPNAVNRALVVARSHRAFGAVALASRKSGVAEIAAAKKCDGAVGVASGLKAAVVVAHKLAVVDAVHGAAKPVAPAEVPVATQGTEAAEAVRARSKCKSKSSRPRKKVSRRTRPASTSCL